MRTQTIRNIEIARLEIATSFKLFTVSPPVIHFGIETDVTPTFSDREVLLRALRKEPARAVQKISHLDFRPDKTAEFRWLHIKMKDSARAMPFFFGLSKCIWRWLKNKKPRAQRGVFQCENREVETLENDPLGLH